jgi:CHAT domain-containing protein
MHAELVTLSSCDTGINEHKPGDELIGLTRAFVYAGTPSVIVSLWPVNDLSTSLLMQEFYKQWGKPGKDGRPITKAVALQAAQRYVKNFTAEDLDKYCLQQLDQASDADQEQKQVLSLGRVYAQAIAGDVRQAQRSYKQLQCQPEAGSSESIKRRSAQVSRNFHSGKAHALQRKKIDYQKRPFEDMYFWAPFVLIGDWQ